jgi:type IV pilus assembly protein PilE
MRKQKGFTLIELIVVMVIIAILAALAVPTYRDAVRKSKRRAAQSVMMEIANREQQYFVANREYADEGALGFVLPPEVDEFYTFSITPDAGPPPGFTITFDSQGMQAADGDLTLNSAGEKTPPDKW